MDIMLIKRSMGFMIKTKKCESPINGGFHNWAVPPNHPFSDGKISQKSIHFGIPPSISMYGNPNMDHRGEIARQNRNFRR